VPATMQSAQQILRTSTLQGQRQGARMFTIHWETERANAELAKFFSMYRKNLSKALKMVAAMVMEGLIKFTPVDTGRARAGWYIPASKLSPGAAATAASHPKPEGAEGLPKGAIKMRLQGSEQYIEMSNLVDYIIMLEFNWSEQTHGQGILRHAMHDGRRHLRRHLRNVLSGREEMMRF